MSEANTINDLLLGTTSPGKIEEMRVLLAELSLRIFTLSDFAQIYAVDETGTTFEENAVLKAQGYARQSGMWTLAEDSGLEVDALDGSPGVFSARYAGEGKSDIERVAFLLDQLLSSPGVSRSARFTCVVAVANAEAKIVNVESGICEGTITQAPSGSNGFGYDPVFVPTGYELTFGELSAETKNAISHRAKAINATRDFLVRCKLNRSTNDD